MNRLVALLLRCLVALALVANGVVATAHAHAGMHGGMKEAALDADVAVAEASPCHGHDAMDVTDGMSDDAPAADPGGPHGCCGNACVCDCVLAPMAAVLPRVGAQGTAPASLPATHVPAPRAGVAQRLLRPPIA
ncbi:CopL family metal-binding regulatory protein [Dokdonella sp. MW10]|uniref:CopL family metal-binding regulatory protein n=1 Tax=Dokdonella sp. MW10 TaxID=2992926 RepID=UPI003F80F186